MECIVYTTSGGKRIIDCPAVTFSWVEERIGCDFVEIVHPRRLPRGYAMLVDEEGLLAHKPLNLIGSLLYETDKHGAPIVGDIMIVKEVYKDGETDFCGMTDEEAHKLTRAIENLRTEMIL